MLRHHTNLGCLPLCAQLSEARANLFGKELRLFPCRKVPAFVDFVVINELAIRPLRPTARGLIVLAGEDAHGSRDSDVDGVVKIELAFPIEARRRNRRIRQPVERDVVEDVVSGKVAWGCPLIVRPSTADITAAAG